MSRSRRVCAVNVKTELGIDFVISFWPERKAKSWTRSQFVFFICAPAILIFTSITDSIEENLKLIFNVESLNI